MCVLCVGLIFSGGVASRDALASLEPQDNGADVVAASSPHGFLHEVLRVVSLGFELGCLMCRSRVRCNNNGLTLAIFFFLIESAF